MTTPYELARKEIGTVEWRDGNNPKVVQYFADSGNAWVKDDETAWCAAFVGAMLKRAGLQGTGKLTARSYLDWGTPVSLKDAKPGDIAIFKRGNSTWQGHVTFFDRQNGAYLVCVGGNQSDQVKESNYAVKDLLGIRRGAAAVPVFPLPEPSKPSSPKPAFWPAFLAWLKAQLKGPTA